MLGFVDETLASEDDDHLTDAIVEDITRQRVGEMRQIISTITPDQYELISREAEGALVIQGGPGTGKTAVGLHRAAWLLYADPELTRAGVLVVGPNETFIRYIEQVLPALGEGGVEQRPIGSLIAKPHGEVDETPRAGDAEGQRADRGRDGAAAVAPVEPRGRDDPVRAPARDRTVTREDMQELVDAVRERTCSYEAGRERFRERLAGMVASRLLDPTRWPGRTRRSAPSARPRSTSSSSNRGLAEGDARGAGRAAVQEQERG